MRQELGIAQDTLPITYMNSAAALKAFVGEKGGAVCTSSNAAKVMEWAYAQKKRVLFFPDQHLGRNTGYSMGIPLEQMVLWGWARPYGSMGGRTLQELQDSRVILWAGHCSVHQRFTPQQIEEARAKHPGLQVIVHPECRFETVQAADLNGSTEFIAKTIAAAPAGSTWAIGTEINLVARLAKENPDKTVFCLDPVVCPCSTMYRVHPAYLAWTIESLAEGHVVNQVLVPEEIAANAKLALGRMLAIK
jgi:quinolinate synthase